MEENRALFNIIKSESQKTKDIVNNVLTMLSRRIYIGNNGEKQQLLNMANAKQNLQDKGDNTFAIKANNGDTYVFKIIYQNIYAVGKQSFLTEFIREYAKNKKILIVSDYNNKIQDYAIENSTQIFREYMLLGDIISHRDQPKFELLSPNEMDSVKTEYNLTDYTMKKLLRTDPVALYFALRKGDIIRIIRPSLTAGESIDYRVVV